MMPSESSLSLSSPQCLALLEELRSHLSPSYPHAEDVYLFKFLVARNGDPEKAAAMYSATMQWRATTNVDAMPYVLVTNHIRGFDFVKDQDFDVLAPDVPDGWADFFSHLGGGCYHKTDKQGYPVYIELFVSISFIAIS